MYTITESITAVSILDITSQFSDLMRILCGSLILAVQTAFFISFLVYARYFYKYQSFRKSTSQFFIISYFTIIIWFASVFTTIETILPGSFYVRKYNYQDKQKPIEFFGQMIYFSAVLGCKTGYGDVRPINLFSKFVVLIHIFFTTYITVIWFRGLSFTIKIETLNQ